MIHLIGAYLSYVWRNDVISDFHLNFIWKLCCCQVAFSNLEIKYHVISGFCEPKVSKFHQNSNGHNNLTFLLKKIHQKCTNLEKFDIIVLPGFLTKFFGSFCWFFNVGHLLYDFMTNLLFNIHKSYLRLSRFTILRIFTHLPPLIWLTSTFTFWFFSFMETK